MLFDINEKTLKKFNNLVDKVVLAFSPKWALERKAYRHAFNTYRDFAGSSRTGNHSDWIVGNGNITPTTWELKELRNRSRDINRNEPIGAGITDTLNVNVVGSGLRFQSKIRAEVLGISESKAEEYRNQAETAITEFSKHADSANILTFEEIQWLAFRKIIEDGEIIALPGWATEPWRSYNRVLELVEADRLESKGMDIAGSLEQGIELGSRGQPIRYHFKKPNSQEFEIIDARDSYGRPKVLHIFPTKRPGQLRGIPFFAPVISYFRNLARYLDAEVVAARVTACLALIFTKKTNPNIAAQYNSFGTEVSDNGKTSKLQEFKPGMVHYAAEDEEVVPFDPNRPGITFQPFVETSLRMIGAALGLPYELVLKDFSKTNYSSARAALLEGRRMFSFWRTWFVQKFNQPVSEFVLEEAFLKDLFNVRDFYTYRSEYCRGIWLGNGWGWVDPVKEVEASRLAIDSGLSTLAEENAAQGRDWQETLAQRKRERPLELEAGILPSEKTESAGETKNVEPDTK
ncbi:MAG: phage portal protein [Candidatus Riflebacteria bacterium]|nr:phage portal protein [Candidatus Riflebacteria bacterium]